MSLYAHLDALKTKHTELKRKIEDAYTYHLPDLTLIDLKKEKLRIKEEIFLIEQQLKETSDFEEPPKMAA